MISIITVVYNDCEGFVKTAESVFAQRVIFPDIEYIVIDGGSTDGTVDCIKNFSSGIDYWVSEKDCGIYDAMNKGAVVATGSALLFLNAGDYFVGDVLRGFTNPPVYLKVKYVDFLGRFRDRPLVDERLGISNCHQGIVFENKKIKYDTNFQICADYKYFLDHGYTKKIKVLESSGYVFFDAVGVSSQKIGQRDAEIFSIRRKYYGRIVACLYELLPFFKRMVRFFLKGVVKK